MDNAISCYRHAIKLCHQSQLCVLYHEMGSLYEKTGDFEEAGHCFMDAGSFRDAVSAFVHSGDLFAAIRASESIPEADKRNADLVLSFLLKLSANQIHVLKVTERSGDSSSSRSAAEKRCDMRRISSINMQDTHVAIRFPVIPLVSEAAAAAAADKRPDGGRSPKPEDELLLMNPDVLSLNITLESLYYFLRDHRNVNSVSERVRSRLASEVDDEEEDEDLLPGSSGSSDAGDEEEGEEEGDEGGEGVEEDGKRVRNEETSIRRRLLNELFARIQEPLQRKLIHDLLKD